MTTPVRVALVNDFELIVRGLTGMLGPFHHRLVVTELDVGTNPGRQVDVVLFDTFGQARAGLERVHSLAADSRVGAVAVYTWALPPEQLDAVMAAGARAVLSKSMSAAELSEALIAVDAGEIVISPVLRGGRDVAWPGHDFGLTPRESEVAAFLAEGLSNREIADALCLSEHTVKSHLKSIFRKAGVVSRAQAVARITSDAGFRRYG